MITPTINQLAQIQKAYNTARNQKVKSQAEDQLVAYALSMHNKHTQLVLKQRIDEPKIRKQLLNLALHLNYEE